MQEDLTFQSIDQEMASLPGCYAAPTGCIILACAPTPAPAPTPTPSQPSPAPPDVGCVAIRPLASGERTFCEMKRLWVQDAHQGCGLGRRLVEAAVEAARGMGYRAVVLDTLERLAGANRLYDSLGFRRREAYYHNPLPNVVYWQLDLE